MTSTPSTRRQLDGVPLGGLSPLDSVSTTAFSPRKDLVKNYRCTRLTGRCTHRFDGHYINNKSIPAGAKWIEDANFFNWAISAGSRSELLGLGDLHGCSNPESSRCIFQRGGDAVDYYGFRDKPFRKAITAIMLISVALRALAFVAFKFLFTGRPVFDSCSSKKQ